MIFLILRSSEADLILEDQGKAVMERGDLILHAIRYSVLCLHKL